LILFNSCCGVELCTSPDAKHGILYLHIQIKQSQASVLAPAIFLLTADLQKL